MALSSDLVSQFTKVTNDSKRDTGKTTLRGNVVKYDEALYVQLDGSNEITPISRTVEVAEGDRVEVSIENHAATVTGNLTDPSVGIVRAGNLESKIEQTAEAIRLEVSNLDRELTTKIEQTSESITMTVTNNQKEFSEFKQTVEGFSFMGTGGTVKISGGDIELTGAIKWTDLNSAVQLDITEAQEDAADALVEAELASESASEAYDTARSIANGKYIDGTFIDGKSIKSPSIEGNEIKVHGTFQTIGHDGVNQTVTGYMGAAVGEDSYGNETLGVALSHTWSYDDGSIGDSYVIVTNAGVRLQHDGNRVIVGSSGIYLNTDSSSKAYYNGVEIGSGGGNVQATWG